jgi:serine/threonine-protein kinase
LQAALGAAYAIERELGGGGMSRVFVADEASLGRKVVVKVLRSDLAEGLSAERFKREVRVAARLQHPHIVPLLAAGELTGGVLYYTMPLVEGESLRDRLTREDGLPLEASIAIMRDVSSALAYAHRAGIVHRDVKPENILLSHGGAVVADFGIAKAISASRAADGDDAERRSITLTSAGTSLGTPAYMAPEQAAGDAVDHRTDLYALGVVAYEMLAGRPPFEGRNARQLLAAHATEVPDPIATRRPAVTQALGALVMQLLEKHPADRPQSADDVLRALEAVAAGHTVAETGPEAAHVVDARSAPVGAGSRGWSRLVPRIAFGTAAAVAGAALAVWLRPAPDHSGMPVMSAILPPPGHEMRPPAGMALSADGKRLAFVAGDALGGTAIWVRSLDSLTATRIPGTEGAVGPFWSPTGTSLGYFANGQLQILDLRLGTRRAVCPVLRAGGAVWTDRDTIVYAPDFRGLQLFRVPAKGGTCAQLTHFPESEFDHRPTSALPGGTHVLFSSNRANFVRAVEVGTGKVTEVRSPGRDGRFVAPHWLVFRDREYGPLYAQRLDLRTLQATGESYVLIDRVPGPSRFTSFTASGRVIVAVQSIDTDGPLLWVDRQSAVVDSLASPAMGIGAVLSTLSASLSRDGRRIVFGGLGMWIYDRDRKVATSVRAQTMDDQGIVEPSWSPGDSLIAYGVVFRGPTMLRMYRVATGTSDSLFAWPRRGAREPAWSPDGRRIAFQLTAGDTVPRDEIWIYSLADRRAVRPWHSVANFTSPRWSPDGQWLAYVSNEMGAPEVFVRRVTGEGVAMRVSKAGGEAPQWSTDGGDLYYRAPDGAIMASRTRLGPAITLSTPRTVVASPPFSRLVRGFEITSAGNQFVGLSRGEPQIYTLLVDWANRLPER